MFVLHGQTSKPLIPRTDPAELNFVLRSFLLAKAPIHQKADHEIFICNKINSD